MKKIGSLFTLILTLSAAVFAQHCPFDGYYMIVVHLTDAKNKPIGDAEISLREIESPQAESCAFAKGLLNKPFAPARSMMNSSFDIGNIKNNAAERFCADCSFLGAGYYAVILESAETKCIIYDRENNLSGYQRKYEIRYADQTLPVKETQIYRLCWAEGRWSRIKPIKLRSKSGPTAKRFPLRRPIKSTAGELSRFVGKI